MHLSMYKICINNIFFSNNPQKNHAIITVCFDYFLVIYLKINWDLIYLLFFLDVIYIQSNLLLEETQKVLL